MLLGGVLDGVALWSVLLLGGVALWSVVLGVLLLLVDEPVLLLPACAIATAHESTRIAIMPSVLFIQYLARIYLTAPLPSIIRRS